MGKINVTFFDDIAEEVKSIDAAMKQISNSNLNEKAIVLLVCKLSGENQTTVKNVLYGLENIGSFLKKGGSR